ncbi:pho-4 [Scenedesmus sp. PABB004]|nr:pho-4 [Scenedesmus sp. PABB004]
MLAARGPAAPPRPWDRRSRLHAGRHADYQRLKEDPLRPAEVRPRHDVEADPRYRRTDFSEELAAQARVGFAACLAAGEARLQLARAALLVAAEDDAVASSSTVPFPVDAYLARISRLAADVAAELDAAAAAAAGPGAAAAGEGRWAALRRLPPQQVVAAMEHALFARAPAAEQAAAAAAPWFAGVRSAGFALPPHGRSALPRRTLLDHPGVYEDARLAYLNDVLVKRRGCPAALAILYSEVAAQLLLAGAIDFTVTFDYGNFSSLPAAAPLARMRLSPAPPPGAGGARGDARAELLNTCSSDALAELLRHLKRAYWPFPWDTNVDDPAEGGRASAGGFRAAAKAALGSDDISAALRAVSATAAHRLQRGIWTSPGAGDLMRCVAAAERLVMLVGDEQPQERRDLAVLLLHAGQPEAAAAELGAYLAAVRGARGAQQPDAFDAKLAGDLWRLIGPGSGVRADDAPLSVAGVLERGPRRRGGAADVANMFGPSVGARALTMRQALLIAAVFEFLGAVLMGSGVVDTMRSGITNIDRFVGQPDVLAYGMLCALAGTAIWMMAATYFGVRRAARAPPPRALFSGAARARARRPPARRRARRRARVRATPQLPGDRGRGWGAVVWSTRTAAFPYVKGMTAIVRAPTPTPRRPAAPPRGEGGRGPPAQTSFGPRASPRPPRTPPDPRRRRRRAPPPKVLSWLFSPLLAGVAAFLLFWAVRTFVLRSANAYGRSVALLPLFTLVTFFTLSFFIMAKGAPGAGWDKLPDTKKAWISAVVAVGAALVAAAAGIPLLRRKVQRDLDEQAANAAAAVGDATISIPAAAGAKAGAGKDAGAVVDGAPAPAPGGARAAGAAALKFLTRGMDADIHEARAARGAPVVESDARTAEIHAAAETFDAKAETSFKYLQARALSSLRARPHRACAARRAAVPPSARRCCRFRSAPAHLRLRNRAHAPADGYKVMQSMGVRMTRLTNSRGFCVELCVAAVVIVASRFGIPLSSTPATVGAIAGVGLWEGSRGFNGRLFVKFVCGWIVTVIATVTMTCLFMAQGLYSPNRASVHERIAVGAYLNASSNAAAGLLAARGAAAGNATLAAQAAEISAATAGQQGPLHSLIGPMATQQAALAYLGNASLA